MRINRSVTSPEAARPFFEVLRALHLRAGEPSTRELARRIGKGTVSHTTIHSALRGRRVPQLAVFVAIGRVLGADEGRMTEFWSFVRSEQVASATPTNMPPSMGEVEEDHRDRVWPFRTRNRCSVPLIDLRLSPRESQVATLVAEGFSNRRIASQLLISPHTVTDHIKNIYRKLGVQNRAALTRVVMERNVLMEAK